MKIPERTGKWVEVERTADRDGEVTIKVPNTIWTAWMMDVYLKDDDLATCLRSLGWQVTPPRTGAHPA